jgi:hypothetical protein
MRSLFSVLAAAALLTACQSSQTSASPQPTLAPAAPSAASRPTPAPCPAVNRPALRWPAAIPADVPKPPAAVLGEVKTAAGGLTLVRFTTASSLQESVLFVVKEVQKAGYTLGRGDAEPSADRPIVGVLLQVVLAGLSAGAVLGLVALGFTLVAGTVRVLNLAHGDLVVAAVFAGVLGVLGRTPVASLLSPARSIGFVALTLAAGGLLAGLLAVFVVRPALPDMVRGRGDRGHGPAAARCAGAAPAPGGLCGP